MSENEGRKIAVTQLDEIWGIASKRWGDPGRRTPKPDPRFEELRKHLNCIEQLFGENSVPQHPAVASMEKRLILRPPKQQRPANMFDDDDGHVEEPPF